MTTILDQTFPELRTQQYRGRQKIDIEIGNIGIEIKVGVHVNIMDDFALSVTPRLPLRRQYSHF